MRVRVSEGEGEGEGEGAGEGEGEGGGGWAQSGRSVLQVVGSELRTAGRSPRMVHCHSERVMSSLMTRP